MPTLVLKAELLQEDVAAWNRVVALANPVGAAESHQWHVQAAMVAGWIVEPAHEVEQVTSLGGRTRTVYKIDGGDGVLVEVGKLSPRRVTAWGRQILALYKECMTPEEDEKN